MKFLISVLAAVSLIVIGVPVLKVNAQDISNSPDNYPFGTLSEGSITETGLTHFTVTNNSASNVTITIGGSDMTSSGDTWTLSDDASVGPNTYGLRAGLEGDGSYAIIVKKNGPYEPLVSNLASMDIQKWGLELLSPTSFSDGALKSGIVTLTATQG